MDLLFQESISEADKALFQILTSSINPLKTLFELLDPMKFGQVGRATLFEPIYTPSKYNFVTVPSQVEAT